MERRKQIEKEISELRSKIGRLNNEAEALEIKGVLPRLRKKFEGKCFKFHNSYGGDSVNWWLYVRITEVTTGDYCKAIKAEISSRGEFKLVKTEYNTLRMFKEFSDYTPISISEYRAAINRQIKWLKENS